MSEVSAYQTLTRTSRRKYLFFSVQSCIIFLRHAARLRAN